MSLSLVDISRLTVQRPDAVRKHAQRGQIPTLGRRAFDVLAYEVADALVRSGGCDRTVASRLVHRASRALKATAPDLDAHPAWPAFLCFGFRDGSQDIDAWGSAADLAEVMTNRPLHPFFRFVVVDVALAAARLRKRAKELGIELERWTEPGEPSGVGGSLLAERPDA
jgi:hypothetical protein